MNFFSFQRAKLGMYLNLAWIVLATYTNTKCYVIKIHLPLFQLATKYNTYGDSWRFGWWVPMIAFKWEPGCIKWLFTFVFHSDFMDETEETDSMGYSISDPYAVRNLPIYKG